MFFSDTKEPAHCMRTDMNGTTKLLVACCFCIILGGTLLFCGCTQAPATPQTTTIPTTAIPATTQVPPVQQEKPMVYNESANNSTVTVSTGKEFVIELRENPTTGYSWNATVTPGLLIVNDIYTMDTTAQGMVGVGGTHSWMLKGSETGPQQFRATYMRPWENVTGSEEKFILNVNVVKA